MPARKDGNPPQKLNAEQKQYIVLRLAMYGEPSAIIKEMEVFEPPIIGLTHQAVSKYDPSTAMGANLGEELTEMFWKARERWGSEIMAVPIAHQRKRLELLGNYLTNGQKALPQGLSPKFFLDGLELVEKMTNGFFRPQQAEVGGASGLLMLRELLRPQPGEAEAPAWGPIETPKDGKPA